MTATPPRPASPSSRPPVVPKSGHTLQISPNLEALLEHDELTRRSSSSMSAYHTTTSQEFPVSLPPPPRKAKGSLKTGQREQEPFPTTRSKEVVQRRKVVPSDFWSGALPAIPDAGQSASATCSRSVTPNPYLNPTPILRRIDTPPHSDTEEYPAPKQAENIFPAETWDHPNASDPSHRPSKAEKTLWTTRDSLHLFGCTNGLRRDDRAECGDVDAVQDRRTRQVPAEIVPFILASSLGNSDTATVVGPFVRVMGGVDNNIPSRQSSSRSGYPQQAPSESHLISDPATPIPTAHLLPRLYLPSTSMSNDSSPRLPSIDSLPARDYLSFIDFCSTSTPDELNSCNAAPHDPQGVSASRREPQSITIPSSGLYSTSRHSVSSTSLASMKFAPPSPTSLMVHQLSPTYSPSEASLSSVPLSSITFAPPSPFAERILPTRLQPLSGPPSPYSPLEFAPPPSSPRESIDRPPTPELPPERGRGSKLKKRSVSLSPPPLHHSLSLLPPTTNQLDAHERADRVRRNRKLARVFGRIPGTQAPVESWVPKKLHSPSLAAFLTKQKSHRHALSISASLKASGTKTEPSTPWRTSDLWSPSGRRHSTPLTTSSFNLYVDDEEDTAVAKNPLGLDDVMGASEAASTRSFIDLSDEEIDEIDDDDFPSRGSFVPCQNRRGRPQQGNSTLSLVDSFDSDAQAEAERRRKREKLARLHRFLGSSVPPEAVNGNLFGLTLHPVTCREESNREHWLRRNRNAPSDYIDRGREELDEREKALNVRRAQKMERVFGTPPPQVLFHTRSGRPTAPISQPASPTYLNPYVLTLDISSSSRNPNQSAYVGKAVSRRSPSDSLKCLLPHKEDTPQSSPSSLVQSLADSYPEGFFGFQEVLARSSVYLNYQHSLNSLVDIIDRDDRKSLVELHRFLHGEDDDPPSEEELPVNPRRVSNATSFKSERRHSLPSNASMMSMSSEFSASPKTSLFQMRRRKAAKLAHFFGVDYRELTHDILESIEKGVEEERNHGTLGPQEVEVLMHRVRSLRTMQDPFPH